MLYDEERRRVGEVAEGLLRHYCNRHGYGCSIRTVTIDQNRNPSWNKVLVMRGSLLNPFYDQSWWIDADCFILDSSRPIESLLPSNKVFAFSQDQEGLCAGFFGVRHTPWAISLLEAWWTVGSCATGRKWEQDSFKALLSFPEVSSRVCLIPVSDVGNPQQMPESLPFAWHGWANWRGEQAVLDDYQQLSVRFR